MLELSTDLSKKISQIELDRTLKAGQTPIATARAFAAYINACTRPYRAKAAGNKAKATVTIVFVNK